MSSVHSQCSLDDRQRDFHWRIGRPGGEKASSKDGTKGEVPVLAIYEPGADENPFS